MGARLQGLLVILGLLGVWEVASRVALVNPAYLPPPSAVLLAWRELAVSGELAEHVMTTIRVWVQGFALALLLGVTLGLLMGLFRPLAATLATAVELLRPMPSVAIIPIAIISFGLEDPMKRFVTMYAATWPILINTLYGVRSVDPVLIDTARTFRFSAPRRALRVVLPAASPYIATGLRLGAGIALILVVTAELVASRNGLGYFVAQSQLSYKIPEMYAGILSIAVLGYLLNLAFVAVESRALGWHRRLTARDAG
jgi:NitT/TauT family transport system permease protein